MKRILFILLLFLLPFVYAAPPVTTTSNLLERGIDIIHPDTLYIKNGNDLEVHFWTYNSTTGQTFTNATVNCTVYLIDMNGNNTLRLSSRVGAGGYISYGKGGTYCQNCWWGSIKAGNLTNGVYSYQIKCQGPSIGGYETGAFEVTPTGKEHTIAQSITYVMVISLILLILAASIFAFMNIQPGNIRNEDGKILKINWKKYIKWFLFGLIYICIVSLTYFAWNISWAFLEFSALSDFFKMLFRIELILSVPIFIVSVILMVIYYLQDKEWDKMLARGLHPK